MTGEPPSHGARADPGGPALQNPAHIQTAEELRASADGSAESAVGKHSCKIPGSDLESAVTSRCLQLFAF